MNEIRSQAETNIDWPRPENEDPSATNNILQTLKTRLKAEDDKRNHWLKASALISLVLGFFFSSVFDIYLILEGQEKWVTDLYSKTIVPSLTLVLGATAFSEKK